MAIIYSSKNVNDLVNYSKTKLSLGGAQLSDEYYYDSLPLCLIDAIFSIGVRYSSTSKTVNNYTVSKGIKKISKPLGTRSDSYKIDNLINDIQNIDDFINDIVKKGLQVILYHDSPWEHIESEKKSINNEKEIKEEDNKDIQGVESVIEAPIVKRIKINRHE